MWRGREVLSSMKCRIDFLCFLPRKMTSEKISKQYFNMQARKFSISRLITYYSVIPLGSSLKLPHFNIRNTGKKTLSKLGRVLKRELTQKIAHTTVKHSELASQTFNIHAERNHSFVPKWVWDIFCPLGHCSRSFSFFSCQMSISLSYK